MPAQKNKKMNAIAERLGLTPTGSTLDHLMILLGKKISREEMLASMWYIRKHNEPNDSDKEFMQILVEKLKNCEPHQLDSFDLLSRWREFSHEVVNYCVDHRDTSDLSSWNTEFKWECYRFLFKMYGCEARAPQCPERLLKEFPKAMESKPKPSTRKMWEEMLFLWSFILPEDDQSQIEECMTLLAS